MKTLWTSVLVSCVCLFTSACQTTPSQEAFLAERRLEKMTADYIVAKPLEVLRKEVLREIRHNGGVAVEQPQASTSIQHLDQYAFYEDESGYEGYRRISTRPSDRFLIVSENRTYQGIRVSPNQSLIRVSNAMTGRLIREELDLIRKTDPEGARNLEKRAEVGLIPPFSTY